MWLDRGALGTSCGIPVGDHLVELQGYRENEHGLCTRMTLTNPDVHQVVPQWMKRRRHMPDNPRS